MHLSQDQWNSYVLAKIKVWCVKLFVSPTGWRSCLAETKLK